MFVPKVQLFPFVCWFLNLALKGKHGTKTSGDHVDQQFLVA